MKNIKISLWLVLVVFLTGGLSSCGVCDCAPPPHEREAALLMSAEWNKPIVTADDVDQSDLYKDFTIKFSKETYAVSGGGPLWPSTGTWAFINDDASVLMLDGNREVQLNEITETSLTLTVQNYNTTFISGRTHSVKGKNVFKLKKK